MGVGWERMVSMTLYEWWSWEMIILTGPRLSSSESRERQRLKTRLMTPRASGIPIPNWSGLSPGAFGLDDGGDERALV